MTQQSWPTPTSSTNSWGCEHYSRVRRLGRRGGLLLLLAVLWAGVTWVVVSDGPKIWLRKGTADWQDMTRKSLRHATGGLVRGLAMTAHGVLIVVCQSGYTCYLLNPDATL